MGTVPTVGTGGTSGPARPAPVVTTAFSRDLSHPTTGGVGPVDKGGAIECGWLVHTSR